MRATSGIGSPSESTIRAPPSSTAASMRRPTHSGSTIGSTTFCGAPLANTCGRSEASMSRGRAGPAGSVVLCHGHILLNRARFPIGRREGQSA